jgi:hypothetical protein
MSTDRDVTRALRSWLHEDAHEDAERVLNLVLEEIDTTPQRRAAWLTRRFPLLTKSFRFAALAAVILVAVVVTIKLLPGGGIGGPTTTPTAKPSASAASTVAAFDPCSLLTATEAFQAGGGTGVPNSKASNQGSDWYCVFPETGGYLLTFTYDAHGGATAFAQQKKGPGVQAVPGIGDDAIWLPSGKLAILKGDKEVQITIPGADQPNPSDPGKEARDLAFAKAVGAIIAGRM